MEPIQPRRLDPEIVEAINEAVDKALRSSGIAAQSRPQGIEQRQAPAGGIGWMGVGTFIAAFALMIGVVVWQSDSISNNMDARFQDMNARFQDMNAGLQSMDARFQDMNARLQDMDARFQDMDARFQDMNARLQDMDARLQDMDARLQDMNARLQDAQTERLAQFGSLQAEISALRSAYSSLAERMLHIENLIEDRWPSAP